MNENLKITIPRKPGSAKNYYDLVRKHGKSRKAMVDFICGIGGYPSRHNRYAVEFNIKDNYSDTGADNLWKLLCSGTMDVGPDAGLPPEHLAQIKALFYRVYAEHGEHLYSWGLEEAYENWSDSDTPYETFASVRVDWKWVVEGRSGGHLCMSECEGINLELIDDELEDLLTEVDRGEYSISNKRLRALFIICVQNTVDLDSRKISAEIEYRAAWRLWVSFIEDQIPALLEAQTSRAALSEAAGDIMKILGKAGMVAGRTYAQELPDIFKTICTLADVEIGE